MYPVFTDGKKFYHSGGKSPDKSRFAYFSEYDITKWKKKEKPTLTAEMAHNGFHRWEGKNE